MTLGELQEKVADKPEHEIFFDKAVKEVLEKVECSVPIVQGDLKAIYYEEHAKRPWLEMSPEDKRALNNLGLNGYCLWASDSSGGELKPVLIAINEDSAKRWFEQSTFRKYDGQDGYYEYEHLTAEQRLRLTICHEIAHAMQTDVYTAESEQMKGHTKQHEDLMYKLVSKVCPEILSIPRRRYKYSRK
jgi:hypothetical protein